MRLADKLVEAVVPIVRFWPHGRYDAVDRSKLDVRPQAEFDDFKGPREYRSAEDLVRDAIGEVLAEHDAIIVDNFIGG